MGSRIKRLGTSINRKSYRHYLGRLFATAAAKILRLGVYDTQCGAKLFHVSIIDIFNGPFVTKWLFDVELLARINKQFPEVFSGKFIEYPLAAWEDVSGSKLKFSYYFKVPIELWRIHKKYK
ncbi:MAG: hypothetical protein HC896_09200 [Bacteroidales bacterium]|nr:hypothetical protein [Bacteroidales bacterium]